MTTPAPMLNDNLNTFAREPLSLPMPHRHILYVDHHEGWLLLAILRYLLWALPSRPILVLVAQLQIGRVECFWDKVLSILVHLRLAPCPWLAALSTLLLGLVTASIPILGLVARAPPLIIALALALTPLLVAIALRPLLLTIFSLLLVGRLLFVFRWRGWVGCLALERG